MTRILQLFEKVLDFLFPPTCPLCGVRVEQHGELCINCFSSFNWIDGPKCVHCGYPFPAGFEPGPARLCVMCAVGGCQLDIIRSACVYDDASRAAMLPFKHCGKIGYGRFMSQMMIWALSDTDIQPDVIMPVPLATRRLRHRSYNQATILARPIARVYGLPLDVDSVRREFRPDMGHKTPQQRRENIHNVFNVVKPDKIRGKKILLVDDVMTSGATFMEMHRVLMNAGAKAVYGVSFCRVARAL